MHHVPFYCLLLGLHLLLLLLQRVLTRAGPKPSVASHIVEANRECTLAMLWQIAYASQVCG